MEIDKSIGQKEYEFQGLKFKLKERSMEVRQKALQSLDDYLFFAKDYKSEKIAQYAFYSDENKCKELFSNTLDGDIEKINYEMNDNDNFILLMGFIDEVIRDFFSFIFKLQKKTSENSEN